VWGRNKAKFGNEDSDQVGGTLKNSMKQNDEDFTWFKEEWFKKDVKNQDEHTDYLKDDFREISLGSSSQKLMTEDKIASLIKKIRNCEEKLVAPKLDLVTSKITYPILKEIDESDSNVSFLENLTKSGIGILEKSVYEKLVVCPQHPKSYNVNVRLYCPKCSSMEIEKLHLFEHKICGYISEKKNFVVSENEIIIQCPSCNKNIEDGKKELRIPAMWYSCSNCEKKFDDVTIKLHCRQFNHDFDINMARNTSVPCFRLKDLDAETNFGSSLIDNLKSILSKYEFYLEENSSIKGKSGHYHNIDLIASDNKNNTIFIFLIKSNKEIDESKVNSKIIPILDSEPNFSVIICSSMSKKAKSLAAKYKISVIQSLDSNNVINSMDELFSGRLNKFELT